ncbi:MAG: dihydroorotate dehydrogenase electron transfer subunit [Dehalococcoidia bacterium]
MKQTLGSVASNVEVVPGVHLMWIEAPDIAAAARPGQFVTLRCGDSTLRRPFSIHQSRVDRDSGEGAIALLFKVTGRGTSWLSQQKKGNSIDILGPLGKGFTIESGTKNLLLVAGGIGIAPLVFLAQHAGSQHRITLIHGAQAAAQLYPFSYTTSESRRRLPPLPTAAQLIPVTEDGSMGRKGKATDILPDFLDWADQIYACGPLDMYRAMALYLNPSPAKKEGKTSVEEGAVPSRDLKLKKCQVSLEVRMGCGFGACYGCTIDTRKGPKCVCSDGPVFELQDIIWQEVRL